MGASFQRAELISAVFVVVERSCCVFVQAVDLLTKCIAVMNKAANIAKSSLRAYEDIRKAFSYCA